MSERLNMPNINVNQLPEMEIRPGLSAVYLPDSENTNSFGIPVIPNADEYLETVNKFLQSIELSGGNIKGVTPIKVKDETGITDSKTKVLVFIEK